MKIVKESFRRFIVLIQRNIVNKLKELIFIHPSYNRMNRVSTSLPYSFGYKTILTYSFGYETDDYSSKITAGMWISLVQFGYEIEFSFQKYSQRTEQILQ